MTIPYTKRGSDEHGRVDSTVESGNLCRVQRMRLQRSKNSREQETSVMTVSCDNLRSHSKSEFDKENSLELSLIGSATYIQMCVYKYLPN